jgi:hypothetical protein
MPGPLPDENHTLPSTWSPGFVAKLRLPAIVFTSVRFRQFASARDDLRCEPRVCATLAHQRPVPPASRVVKYPSTALTIASPACVRQLSDISCFRSLRLDT